MIRPFVKWAGGKRQLVPHLRRFVPARFGQYFEPFVGSGALFFDLVSNERIGDRGVWLTDINHDLLGTYRALARHAEQVIAALQEHERLHHAAPAEYYYRVRDELFNPGRGRLFDRAATVPPIEEYSPTLAAMFIYLNRTGFNGLFRLNSRGAFNVPAGRYTNPRICHSDNLRAVAAVLGAPAVHVAYGSFDLVLEQARREDLVYFDPPYAPVSTTANFTAYTASGFCDDDQRRLQSVTIELAQRGCHVVVSNSTAPLIAELYANSADARRAGLRAHKVQARRAINSNGRLRGNVGEYIISNVPPH